MARTDSEKPEGPADGARRALERARDDAARLADDLRAELASIGESTEANPDDEHDAEGSTVGYERARVTGLLERAERALGDATAALERVREGSYGSCLRCGAAIADERIAALPTTTRCTACAAAPPEAPWAKARSRRPSVG